VDAVGPSHKDVVVLAVLRAKTVNEPVGIGRERNIPAGFGDDLGSCYPADNFLFVHIVKDLAVALLADDPVASPPFGVAANESAVRGQSCPVRLYGAWYVNLHARPVQAAPHVEVNAVTGAVPEGVVYV
jgi:hypothetical protein